MDAKQSVAPDTYPQSFAELNDRNRASTVDRVRRAIDRLLERGVRPIGLQMIHDETRVLDPLLPPVAVSSILRNGEAYALYEQVMDKTFKARTRRNRQIRGQSPRARLIRKNKTTLTDAILVLAAEVRDLRKISEVLADECYEAHVDCEENLRQ